jgi:hypothetical protein
MSFTRSSAAIVLALVPAAAAADETVRGRLTAADPAANRLTVKTDDRAIDLAVTPQSKLEAGGKAVRLADLNTGGRVRVTYRAVNGANQVVSLRPAVTTDAGLRREVSEALAATKDYTHKQRAEFAARVRALVGDLDDRIDHLEAEVKDAGADARRRLEPRLTELRRQRVALNDRLGRVGAATADAWDEIKVGFGNAARELERALDPRWPAGSVRRPVQVLGQGRHDRRGDGQEPFAGLGRWSTWY